MSRLDNAALLLLERYLITLNLMSGEADGLPDDDNFVRAVQGFQRDVLGMEPPTEEANIRRGEIPAPTFEAVRNRVETQEIPAATAEALRVADGESSLALEYRQEIVRVAFGELGNIEGPNNDVSAYPYMPAQYAGQGLPWCSGMTDWIRNEAAEYFGMEEGDVLLPYSWADRPWWQNMLGAEDYERDNVSAEKQLVNAETYENVSGTEIYRRQEEVARSDYQPSVGDSIMMLWESAEGGKKGHTVTIVGIEERDGKQYYLTVGGNMPAEEGGTPDAYVVRREYAEDDPRIKGFIDNGALFDARRQQGLELTDPTPGVQGTPPRPREEVMER